MKIKHGKTTYTIEPEVAIAIEKLGRRKDRRTLFVRACERDKSVCVLGVTSCKCCKDGHGYPEDGKSHVTLMSIDAFSDYCFQEGVMTA